MEKLPFTKHVILAMPIHLLSALSPPNTVMDQIEKYREKGQKYPSIFYLLVNS